MPTIEPSNYNSDWGTNAGNTLANLPLQNRQAEAAGLQKASELSLRSGLANLDPTDADYYQKASQIGMSTNNLDFGLKTAQLGQEQQTLQAAHANKMVDATIDAFKIRYGGAQAMGNIGDMQQIGNELQQYVSGNPAAQQSIQSDPAKQRMMVDGYVMNNGGYDRVEVGTDKAGGAKYVYNLNSKGQGMYMENGIKNPITVKDAATNKDISSQYPNGLPVKVQDMRVLTDAFGNQFFGNAAGGGGDSNLQNAPGAYVPKTKQGAKARDDFNAEVVKGAQTTKFQEQDSLLSTTKELVNSDNPVANSLSKIGEVRALLGSNRLTNVELTMGGGSQDVMSKVQQWFESNATGQFTDKNKELITQYLNTVQTALEKRKSDYYKRVASIYSSAAMDNGFTRGVLLPLVNLGEVKFANDKEAKQYGFTSGYQLYGQQQPATDQGGLREGSTGTGTMNGHTVNWKVINGVKKVI